MRKLSAASLAAVLVCTAIPAPAKAYGGGGGFLFGTVLGLGVGTVIGTSIARPYGYYPYGYYPRVYGYPYAYGYGYPYAGYPYAYGYPPGYAPAVVPAPGVYAVPPGYQQPTPLLQGQVVNSAPAQAAPRAVNPKCQAGQFFNSLTGNCDRR